MFEVGKRYRRSKENIFFGWKKGDIGWCLNHRGGEDCEDWNFFNERTKQTIIGSIGFFDPTPIEVIKEEKNKQEIKPGDTVRRIALTGKYDWGIKVGDTVEAGFVNLEGNDLFATPINGSSQYLYPLSDFELVRDDNNLNVTAAYGIFHDEENIKKNLFQKIADGELKVEPSVKFTIPEKYHTIESIETYKSEDVPLPKINPYNPPDGMACIVKGSMSKTMFGKIVYKEETKEEKAQKENIKKEYDITNERIKK